MLAQFTYDEYGQLLWLLRDGRENLTFSDFRNTDSPAQFFVLRHDLDFSLSAGLKMAQFEAAQGIRASYFLLLTCRHYNLLSERSCGVPRQLTDLGHEVGLHYDVRAMSKRQHRHADLGALLQDEVDILSSLTGSEIQSIAMHNPSVLGEDPFAGSKQFINAYDPPYTQAITYFSDSCGAWRDQTYEAFLHSELPRRLQLLIHPLFWRDTPGDRWERLDQWADETRQVLANDLGEIRELWSQHSGVQEHDRRRAPD